MRPDTSACVAVLASRIRIEERLILEALERRHVAHERIDERMVAWPVGAPPLRCSALLDRAISQTRGFYVVRMAESAGVLTVNSSEVVRVCGDKLLTSAALVEAGIATPRTVVAMGADAALRAIEEMGYPAVIKPVVGSWGRLLAKVNDREAAEAVLEHKSTLGSSQHRIVYVQAYVAKPGRDIRTLVLGDEVISAMYRRSDHWITNTARGADPLPCPLTDEIEDVSLRSAKAVGGGALAVDLMEDADGGLLVNEVNHTMEFHGTMEATGVDVAGRLVDYVLARAESR